MYRICWRKGHSILGRENIKKSGCGLCGERGKKKKIASQNHERQHEFVHMQTCQPVRFSRI